MSLTPDTELLFVRHGATAWTAAGRYQGRRDVALSAAGRDDAQQIARRLSDVAIGLVVSSPLARARDTATPIAAAVGAPLRFDERLVELDYGRWEGLTQAEVKAHWPQALRNWKRDIAHARPPGGETLEEVHTRVEDALRALEPPARGAVAIVAHAWIVRVALVALTGESLARARDIAAPPASVHGARLAALASVAHPGELTRQASP